jgi:hypothetical protein
MGKPIALTRTDDRVLRFWRDRVPLDVAFEQVRWERRERCIRARRAGLTYKAIGQLLGLSGWYVSTIIFEPDRTPPVQRYFDRRGDIADLARAGS